MATVSKGRTFVSGETVTPAKLNELVDNATVTSIVDADVSASAAIALSKLATGALPTAITVASANLVDGTIVNADISSTANISGSKLADGAVVQVLQKTESAHAGVTAQIPYDDTVPTSAEGWEIMTQAITPQSNTNKVLASVSVFLTPNNAAMHTVTLFRGTTCIYATSVSQTGQDYSTTVSFQFLDSPATTSSTTYSVRIGASASQTVYINGAVAGRRFGATPKSSLTLMEIKAS